MPLLTLGEVTFDDVDALADHMEDRGERGALEHRGQTHPAQFYLDRLPTDADAREAAEQALWQAATRLVERADDPGVLSMAWAVCGNCQDPAFFEAVLDRLEGFEDPLPTEVQSAFVDLLPNHFPATHPLIGPRVRSYTKSAGLHNTRVEVLIAKDPSDELLEEVEKAASAGQLTEPVAQRVATRLARGKPAGLLDAARRMRSAGVSVREAYRDKVAVRAKAWFAQHERDLESALGL